ncbi:MAG: protein-disulfide reductase DsbD [Pseudomonadota bacterium]
MPQPLFGALRLLLTTALLLLAALPAGAIEEADLLPVEEAFAVTAVRSAADDVTLKWTVADGYYLYRSRLNFISQSPGVTLGEPMLPSGEEKDDEFFGLQETYRGQIDVFLPLQTGTGQAFELEVRSQGCADLGVCYPPHRQILSIEAAKSGGLAASGFPGAASADAGGGLFAGSSSGLNLGGDDALPVDEAFRFETIAVAGDALLARWTIADGYYLYRDQIAMRVPEGSAAVIDRIDLPPGAAKTDEHFGATTVYYGQVEVPVLLRRLASAAGELTLEADYQGCKEAGICYPPVTRSVALDLPAFSGPVTQVAAAAAAAAPVRAGARVSEQDRLATALGTSRLLTLATFFGFGLLLAFTPCVFPMVPILSGIIAGQGDRITTRRAFTLSLIYVLAMALTYTAAGVIAGVFGENLQAWFQKSWVLALFAGLFVLLSLSMFGFYELNLPSALTQRLNRLSDRQEGGTFIGTAIMGVLSALIVGPCVAPPLAAALIYIGQTGDALLGGLALFALSLGMGVPLLIIGTSAGRILPHAGAWMNAVKAVFGVALLGLAIWMLERILAPAWIMLAWGALAIGSGVYLGAFERTETAGWPSLWKALGVLLVAVGLMQLIGAAGGGRDWMQPLKGVFVAQPESEQKVAFEPIKSVADLDRILASAGQPVMLDFYADWCVDCKRMDKYTFPVAEVQDALARGRALKADVTANDDIDQALMSRFNIIGPPAILFFDTSGDEIPGFRVVGYQRPAEFAEHVKAAFSCDSDC